MSVAVLDVGLRKHVAIVLGDDTTDAEIRAEIQGALAVRNWLRARQGPKPLSRSAFLERLSQLQAGGTSYTRLARELNAEIAQTVRTYVENPADPNELISLETIGHGRPASEMEAEEMLQRAVARGLADVGDRAVGHAYEILRWLSFSREEQDEILDLAEENIKANRETFPPDYPVDRARMLRLIRTWRAGRKHRDFSGLPSAREAPSDSKV